MAWRLKSHVTCPPGEFRYEQTEGIRKKFAQHPDIFTLAATVADFRKANSLPRATIPQALMDVDAYNCQRLGNHPNFCYNTDKDFISTVPRLRKSGGCGSCGAKRK